jgi:hypothetical protein
MTADRRHEIGRQTIHDLKFVEMLDSDLNSYMVGYYDKGSGPDEDRYLIYSIATLNRQGHVLRRWRFKNLVPTTELGREAQNRLSGKPSLLSKGQRRRW